MNGDFEKDCQQVLRKVTNWKTLHFYQKSVVLYQLTYVFCKRFLAEHGDRTVDQMVQAARSGKQNIVEGSEDGMTSTEMELKLLNVARSSLQELREDYEDYARSRHLLLWDSGHPRYGQMVEYCRQHDDYTSYEPYALRWTAEEFCNTALTLCHLTDKMMCSYLKRLEREFTTKGGIKERMYAARTGYRQKEEALLAQLQAENPRLRAENARLRALVKELSSQLEDLKAQLERMKKG